MADSTRIDAALVARLAGDAQLAALLPDGVWFNEAAQGKQRFCLVSLITAFDAGWFAEPGGPTRATEDLLYLVKAVTLGTSATTAQQAAARIDALLEDQPLTGIAGYRCLSLERVERIRDTEADEIDATIRWQHQGGRYRLLAAVGGTP